MIAPQHSSIYTCMATLVDMSPGGGGSTPSNTPTILQDIYMHHQPTNARYPYINITPVDTQKNGRAVDDRQKRYVLNTYHIRVIDQRGDVNNMAQQMQELTKLADIILGRLHQTANSTTPGIPGVGCLPDCIKESISLVWEWEQMETQTYGFLITVSLKDTLPL